MGVITGLKFLVFNCLQEHFIEVSKWYPQHVAHQGFFASLGRGPRAFQIGESSVVNL